MTLAVDTRGIDYSGADIDVKDAHRQGASFVIRYSAGAASDPTHPSYDDVKWKLCGPHEIRDAVAAGLDFVANDEWYETRVTEGRAAGRQDGAAALRFWKARGYRKGAVIIVSWDTAPSAAKYDAVEEYLRGYAQALGGYYVLGLYAGDPAVKEMLKRGVIVVGWRPSAASWSDPSGDQNGWYQPGTGWKDLANKVREVSPSHIWQNGNYWYGNGADENVILREGIPSHLGGKAAPNRPSKPAPKPAPAKHVQRPSDGYVVQPGDTLSGIADAHGVTLAALEKANPKAGHPAGEFDNIWPGDHLTIPGGKAPAKPKGKKNSLHTVQPGETLSGIASAWDVSLAAVEKANPHAGHPAGNFDNIWPGDKIVHP